MRNSYMIGQQQKMRRRNMPVTFWYSGDSKFARSANWVLIQLPSLPSMPNYSATGGSKAQVSWNNSFAKRQTNEIFGSPRRVNFWRGIPHSKSLSQLLRHGARTAISPSGSIR